jgi:hypothetical protein
MNDLLIVIDPVRMQYLALLVADGCVMLSRGSVNVPVGDLVKSSSVLVKQAISVLR